MTRPVRGRDAGGPCATRPRSSTSVDHERSSGTSSSHSNRLTRSPPSMSVILLTLPSSGAGQPGAPDRRRCSGCCSRAPATDVRVAAPCRCRAGAARRGPVAGAADLPPIAGDDRWPGSTSSSDPTVTHRRPGRRRRSPGSRRSSLLCLVGWLFSWLVDRHQGADRSAGATGSTIVGIAGLVLTPATVHAPGAGVDASGSTAHRSARSRW